MQTSNLQPADSRDITRIDLCFVVVQIAVWLLITGR
jgi:hypothetical protein